MHNTEGSIYKQLRGREKQKIGGSRSVDEPEATEESHQNLHKESTGPTIGGFRKHAMEHGGIEVHAARLDFRPEGGEHHKWWTATKRFRDGSTELAAADSSSTGVILGMRQALIGPNR